jgi:hypothetical protein
VRCSCLDADYEQSPPRPAADSLQFVEAPTRRHAVDMQDQLPATSIGVFTALVDYCWQDELAGRKIVFRRRELDHRQFRPAQ